MDNSNNSLSIILPIYNPHEGWEAELLASCSHIAKILKDVDYKIIIVDDGSPANLLESLQNIQTKDAHILLHGYTENRGKGYAIRHGVQQTEATYYIYTDWDFPFGIEPLLEIHQLLLTNKYDLVLSKRGNTYFKAIPLKRKVISIGVRWANYMLTGFKIGDTQAGLKGLSNKARDMLLQNKTDSFIFEFEFVRRVLKHKLPYTFVAVNPKPNIIMSNFKFKTIKKELFNYIKLYFGNKP